MTGVRALPLWNLETRGHRAVLTTEKNSREGATLRSPWLLQIPVDSVPRGSQGLRTEVGLVAEAQGQEVTLSSKGT